MIKTAVGYKSPIEFERLHLNSSIYSMCPINGGQFVKLTFCLDQFLGRRSPEHTKISKKILSGLLKDKYEIYICDFVFAEIIYVLESYDEKNIDFTDAYMTCHAKKAGCNKIFSFDKDFTKIDFLELISI